jgi:hypothetical protein
MFGRVDLGLAFPYRNNVQMNLRFVSRRLLFVGHANLAPPESITTLTRSS